ncbi:hypothetical protein H705_00194 [Bartonella bacilliformis Cond044]|nr:hypothetical protein H705_00194 [Bartonella bacilliformis Cond044]
MDPITLPLAVLFGISLFFNFTQMMTFLIMYKDHSTTE